MQRDHRRYVQPLPYSAATQAEPLKASETLNSTRYGNIQRELAEKLALENLQRATMDVAMRRPRAATLTAGELTQFIERLTAAYLEAIDDNLPPPPEEQELAADIVPAYSRAKGA